MKTKKILGIVILTLVLTLALGVAAYAATNVSTEAELRAALASDKLSKDPANPTKVVLTDDIELTKGAIEIAGTAETPLYVELSGDYTIINNQSVCLQAVHQTYGYAYDNYALIKYTYANLVIKDVTIDANYGSEIGKTGGFAGVLHGCNGDLTLKGHATIKNGGGYLDGFSAGTALTYFGGTFTMEDNSAIIGCKHDAPSSANEGSPVIFMRKGDNASNLIMNGGSITDCIGRWGIFCIQGGSDKFELNKGAIHRNTWVDDIGPISNYSSTAKISISDDMYISYTKDEVLDIPEAPAVIEVATEAEFKAALMNISTDAKNPTKIVLTDDITLTTGQIEIVGSEDAVKYIEIDGQGHKITNDQQVEFRTGQTTLNRDVNDGLFELVWTDITFNNITIDVNYGSEIGSSGGTAVGFLTFDTNVTWINTTIANCGGTTPWDSGSVITAYGGTVTLGEGSLVTGKANSKTSCPALWFSDGETLPGLFVLDGGEISGNNNILYGVIALDRGSEGNLISGFINNNSYEGDAVQCFTSNTLNISENVIIAASGEVLDKPGEGEDEPVVPEEPEEPGLATQLGGSWSTLDGGKKRLYLVAGIDTLNYKNVGFVVTVNGNEKEISTNTVFTSINVNWNGTPTTVKPTTFGEGNNYIFGQGFQYAEANVGTEIKLKAFAETLEGEKLYSKEITLALK